ncbi:MAG: penicillin-insensitive murein endopeptidase [Methyloligellaceae bacterium]
MNHWMGVTALAVTLALGGEAGFAQSVPAKKLFGKVNGPSTQTSSSIGGYAKGCLAGGKMLAIDGPAWQAMRLSRNRNWGHPILVNYIEKLAKDSQSVDGWPGLLVGDLAQPRGGPMLTGHRSHQIGLDADIWMIPMPAKRFDASEREKISAKSVLAKNKISVNKTVWQPGHVTLLRRAASYPGVARIFVHPAIKKELCSAEQGDKSWLRRVRPWWGHHYHFHVRMSCPLGNKNCVNQKPPPAGHGCGEELDKWIARVDPTRKRPKPKKPKVKPKPRRQLTMADLPHSCMNVMGVTAKQLAERSVPLPVRKTR